MVKEFEDQDLRIFLGHLGEAWVRNYYQDMGYELEMADNPYDLEKDIRLIKNPKGQDIDEFVEVKTMAPHWNTRTVNLYPEQKLYDFKKCMTVDRLVYCITPMPRSHSHGKGIYGSEETISLMEAPRGRARGSTFKQWPLYRDNPHNKMIWGWHIDDLTLLRRIKTSALSGVVSRTKFTKE